VSTAELAELQRLIRREKELLAEVARLESANRELTAAAETSRNFKASVDAGHITLDLDNWEAS
jgi:hypothetical protein